MPIGLKEEGQFALLPAGLRDLLPPDAQIAADIEDRLMAEFVAHGYLRVAPPLVEFETTLLAGPGAAMAANTFRLMDPVSQAMMGLTADVTPQIARIATTRLSGEARPLRLCYAGQVVRVRGGQLRSDRQFGQVGAEMFGAAGIEADAEVVLLAAESLTALAVPSMTIDLNLPPLIPAVTGSLGMAPELAGQLRAALDRKDAALVGELAGEHAPLFLALQRAAGPVGEAMAALETITLPDGAAALRHRLACLVAAVLRDLPRGIALTVDPVEYHGFSYEDGPSFAIFARGIRGELGRGGRYRAGRMGGRDGETATGFTFYTDTVVHAAPEAQPRPRVLVAAGTPRAAAAALRKEGWVTVAGLDQTADGAALTREAQSQRCTHLLAPGTASPVAVPAPHTNGTDGLPR